MCDEHVSMEPRTDTRWQEELLTSIARMQRPRVTVVASLGPKRLVVVGV